MPYGNPPNPQKVGSHPHYKVTVGFSIMSTYDDKVEKVKFEYKSIVDYFF